MALPRLPVMKMSAPTGVSSATQTSAPSGMQGIKPSSLKSLVAVKIPKSSAHVKSPKISTKAAKTPKSPSTSKLHSTLKSIISASKKGGTTSRGMGVPSSAVGAPATPPAPSFFGPSNPRPNTFGLGM